jgi:hypothetical protein
VLKKKTFESITAGLTSMVAELRKFAEAKAAEAIKADELAVKAANDAAYARGERDRADATADKIGNLLSV